MTQNQSDLYHHRCSTRQFLFSKTDARNLKRSKNSLVVSDELVKNFPGILVGKRFSDAVMKKARSASKFGILTIQIDRFSGSESAEKREISDSKEAWKLVSDVVQMIDSVCKCFKVYQDSKNFIDKTGIWGLIDDEILGCFFSESNGAFCLKMANKIRDQISKHWNETLTIGIASYPFFHFKKEQIIANACKALDHATFYGTGGTAFFDGVSLNISGDKLYQNGDIKGAIKEFQTAIQVDPSNVNVYNSLGVCYGVLRDYENALKAFRSVLLLNPNEVMAIYNTGLVHLFMGNKNHALRYFLKAEHIGEELFEITFQTGRIYFEIGKFEIGKKFFKKATQLRPDSGAAFRYLGDCYVALNMMNQAIRAYKQAIKQNPFDAASLSAIGYLFDVQGENPEISTVFCQHSVEISPENGLFRYRLGKLYLKQNRLDDALKEFNNAAELGYKDAISLIKKIQNQKPETRNQKLGTG